MNVRFALAIAAVLATAALAARAQVPAQGAAGAALGAPSLAKVAAPPPAATVKAGTGGGSDQPVGLEDTEFKPFDPCDRTADRTVVSRIQSSAEKASRDAPGDPLAKARAYLNALPPRYRESLLSAARTALPQGARYPLDYRPPTATDPGVYPDADTLQILLAANPVMYPPTPYVSAILQRGGSAADVASALVSNHYFWRSGLSVDAAMARFAQLSPGRVGIMVGQQSGGGVGVALYEFAGFVPPGGIDALPSPQDLLPAFGRTCSKPAP